MSSRFCITFGAMARAALVRIDATAHRMREHAASQQLRFVAEAIGDQLDFASRRHYHIKLIIQVSRFAVSLNLPSDSLFQAMEG